MKRIITTLCVLAIAIGVFAPVSFSLTQNHVVAVHTTTAYADNAADQAIYGNIGNCGVVFGSMANCLAYILYFIPFYVGGQVLNLAARFLDFTATLTLSSQMFSSAGFLQVGWAMMRDFANMFFIFVLMYIALCMMLGIRKGGDPKSMIVSVVLIAIIINFSMFITDIIIDTSNVLALVFYNQITVKAGTSGAVASDTALETLQQGVILKDDNGNPTGTTIDTVEPEQIGLALASAFHPQIFTQPDFWTKLKDTDADGNQNVASGKMILILLVMGVVFFVAAWSFFVAAFSFMGRMVELFVLIIFSPLAFVSYVVPGLRGMDRFGWSKWWGSLIKTSFAAPIYFLMILLITIILNAGLFGGAATSVTTATGDNAWIVTLVGSVIVPVVFLWIMLTEATKYAQKASGAVGEKLGGMASAAFKGAGAMVGGAALGAAAGGAAAIGRNTIGRTSEKLLAGKSGQWLLKQGEGTGVGAWAARRAIEAGKAGQKASFDVRTTGAAQKLSKATGMKFESFGTLSTAAAKGGRESQRARQAAEEAKKIELLKNKDARKDIDKLKEQREKDIAKQKEKVHHDEEHLKEANTKYKNLKSTETDEEKKLAAMKKDMPADVADNFKKTSKEIADNEKALKAADAEQQAAAALLNAAQAELAAATARGDSPAEIARLTADRDGKQADFDLKKGLRDIAQGDVDASKAKLQRDHPEIVAQQNAYNTALTARKDFENDPHGLKATEKAAEKSRKDLHHMEHGKESGVITVDPVTGESKVSKQKRKFEEKIAMKDANGAVIKDADGKIQYHKNDDGSFKYVTNADGSAITKEQALSDMGTHELENAAANAEKSNFKNHMFNRMKNRYKDVNEERDGLGNITTMASSGKVGARTLGNQIKQMSQAAGTSGTAAFIAGTAIAGPLAGLAAALTTMAIAGTLEAKKNKDKINMDTQHEAENTVLKNVKDGKATPTHKAVDTGFGDTASYITGALGEVVGKAGAALGVKGGGGGGHAKEHKDDHSGGHGAAEAHGTDHGSGDHGAHGGGGGDHGGAGGGHAKGSH